MHPQPRQNSSITGLSGGQEVLLDGHYRFTFNGKEKDDEVKGLGNSLDFGARMYDSRLGRWLSVDPYTLKYPNLSPYISFENNPICILDPGGDTTVYFSQSGKLLHISYDQLPTAITIISNKEVIKFVRQLLYARSKELENNSGVNKMWRGYGRTFDVTSLRTFYNENTKPGINNLSTSSPTGFLSEGYFNESRAYLYEKDGIYFVGNNAVTDNILDRVYSFPELEPEYGEPVGKVHDHPNEGYSHGAAGFPYEPSDQDMDFAGKIEVIVGRKNIYIHGQDVPYIAIDKQTLKGAK